MHQGLACSRCGRVRFDRRYGAAVGVQPYRLRSLKQEELKRELESGKRKEILDRLWDELQKRDQDDA